MRGLSVLGLAAGLTAAGHALAGTSGYCDQPVEVGAYEQDRLLRFAAVVKQELVRSARGVALIARSGTDLGRFGIRYSHAGIALAANPASPWGVRQLYYACDESRPRLFDQGMAGFLHGSDDPAAVHVSLVLLPATQSAALETATLDTPLALALLAADYSANAYAYSTRYQNCNQWVIEMIAGAWGDLHSPTREEAQQWLRTEGYVPEPITVDSRLLAFAAQFMPLIHLSDHPEDDVLALKLRVSMPATIEDFVRQRVPQAERVQLCHDTKHIVVRRGWQALGPGCRPEPGDEVIAFAP